MLDAVRNSVRGLVQKHGAKFRHATPVAITISLAAAALVPVVLGDLEIPIPILQGLFGLVSSLGQNVLYEFIESFKEKVQAGETPPDEETVQEELEQGLAARWEAAGPGAELLRKEISGLLQRTQSLDTALAAASSDVRQCLAQGLTELGADFREFRWMLDDLRTVLAEVRLQQAEQLAMQREQLDLQRRQLIKTNLLLQLQQERVTAVSPGLSEAAGAEENTGAPADLPCPYKGLASFQPEDAEFFFGREELIARMTAHLAVAPFLAVVGPSGSGKSSVVRAGLLPALWRNALPGSKDWPTFLLTPGSQPLEEVAVRLAAPLRLPPATLLRDIEADPRGLELALRGLLTGSPPETRCLLVVDQLEEIFVLCHQEEERRRFIQAVLQAGRGGAGRILIVFTLRADYYGRCLYYPELSQVLEENNVLVGPLNETELRQAVERPAAQVGLRLQPELVDTLIHEVAGEPGALPLLSHVLLETWKRRRGALLTMSGYLEAGGVSGAVARTADTVFAGLTPGRQTIARTVFLRLTELGDYSAQDARRRASRTELAARPEQAAEVEAVLKTLADARLIIVGEQTVEVAHEALIRRWPTLRNWLNQNRDQLRVHHQLTEDTHEWVDLNRDPGALYRGARLALAREFAAARSEDLNPLEREFLEASIALHVTELDRERKRTEQMRRRALHLAGALLLACLMIVIAAVLGTSAYRQRDEARRQARLTLAGKLSAQAMTHLDDQLDLALLLSVEAHRLDDNVETRGSLLSAVSHNPRLGNFLFGHTETVSSLAFSPDNRILISGSYDGTVRRWDAASGMPIGAPLRGHSSLVCAVACSPRGDLLASGGEDARIRLWNPATGASLGEPMAGHTAVVWGVAFSPSGRLLASVSGDRTVRLWDLATRRLLGEPWRGHTDEVICAAFSPDGKTLATAGNDRTVRFWDVASGRALGPALVGHTHSVWCLAFSPDGKIAASGSTDYSIRLWSVPDGKPLGKPLTGHTGGINGLMFTPDGHSLLSAGSDHTIRFWDVATGQPSREPVIGDPGSPLAACFSRDATRAATSGPDHEILLWDLRRAATIGRPLRGHTGMVAGLAFTDGGRTLLSVSEDRTIRRWPVNSARPAEPPLPCALPPLMAASVSPDGRFLATAATDGTLSLWDAASGKSLGPPWRASGKLVFSLAFRPDGKIFASGGEDGTVCLWDGSTGRPAGGPYPVHDGEVSCLAFSPNGKVLVSGGYDDTIRFWDVTAGRALDYYVTAHTPGVSGLAFSPDGKRFASGGLDNLIITWDAAALQPAGRPLRGHTGSVSRLVFSPDGKTLISGGWEGSLRFWDTATNQSVGPPLLGHDGAIVALAVSPDGRILASSDVKGGVFLWDMVPSGWEWRACRRAGRNLSLTEWRQFLEERPYRKTWRDWPAGK